MIEDINSHSTPLDPQTSEDPLQSKQFSEQSPIPERTGLVLSGGGLKFAVHAGLFKHLEELEYTPPPSPSESSDSNKPLIEAFDCLVGTSAGSLIAAVIACGISADDARLISFIFTQKGFSKYILDPNILGLTRLILDGEPSSVKGIFRGEAIKRTLEVFYSHNFLNRLGAIYCQMAQRNKENSNTYPLNSPQTDEHLKGEIFTLFKKLYNLPRESFETTGPVPMKKDELKLITFQDLNPQDELGQDVTDIHRDQYILALKEYYNGRDKFYNPSLTKDPRNPRPLLLIIGTDLVTGQNTVFANYQLFATQTIVNTLTNSSNKNYYYINNDKELKQLNPRNVDQELRPANYLYKQLPNGLPVAWAVRSSLSLPAIFTPNEICYEQSFEDKKVKRSDFFIDGGVTDNYALNVASDPYIGNCKFILGGNIGNLGRRVHNFNKTNLLDIVQNTLLIMGDANVDSNATNAGIQKARVLTINELTPTEDVSITELEKIEQLYKEGYSLAKQVFESIEQALMVKKGNSQGKIFTLQELFSLTDQNNPYKVILPRIELIKSDESTNSTTTLNTCGFVDKKGAEAVELLIQNKNKSIKDLNEEKYETATKLGECERELSHPTPIKLFPKPLEWWNQFQNHLKFTIFGWLILGPLLGFGSFLGLGLWRLSFIVPGLTFGQGAANTFDKLQYRELLWMVLLGLIFSGALFFRWLLFIIPFEQRDFILYSILLTIIGSVIYVLSAMTAAELKGVWYYILVVLSAQGLVFAVSPWTVLVLQNWVIPFLLRKKAPTGK